MTTVKILRDEPVNIEGRGMVYLKREEVRGDLPDSVVSSLIGRGYGVAVGADEAIDGVHDRAYYEAMTAKELKKIAKDRDVPDYRLLGKTQLVDALAPEGE